MDVRQTLIYLLRHGEVVLAETRRFIGHLDVPMSPGGEAQCAAQARRLAATRIDALYSSDLQRARRSGEIIGAPHGLSPRTLPALREMAMGRWEGLTAEEIQLREPDAFRDWMSRVGEFPFPEGESVPDLVARAGAAFDEIVADAHAHTIAIVAHGGTILYVGTKKQAQEAIAEQARRVGMPFVNQRWLGGMLTNFSTVYKRLQRLKELEEIDFGDVASSGMTKKELLQLRREHDKLDRTLGGIRDMSRVPSAIWVVDTKKEHIAVNEARKLGIPVVAILDTNCDPDEVNYPIPGNDDAIRSVALLTRVVADAVAEGLIARAGAASGDEKPSGDRLGTEEPLAEWERELLQGSASGKRLGPVEDADVIQAQESTRKNVFARGRPG